METILDQIRKPLIRGILIGFLVGTLFGWLAIGWGLWPVEYEGAYPRDLVYEQKVIYLRMAIQAFSKDANIEKAKAHYDALEIDADKALAQLATDPSFDATLIQAFSAAVNVPTPSTSGEGQPPVEAGETPPAQEPKAEKSLISRLLPYILCALGLVIVAGLVYFFLLRNRFRGEGEVTPAMQAQEARSQAAWTDYSAEGAEPPIAQFMASYKFGDDLFDDSFSIDSHSGEFLGECGVGISETIGVGEPKKVTAFEVWLFDKNDIQTVTKVMMSANAFYDNATRQRLEAKGEPVLSEVNGETVLETQALQLVARVVGMSYGDGALPSESYFDQFILELAVWQK